MKPENELLTADGALVRDVRQMIEETRTSVAIAVNAGLTMLYWRIGRRINQEFLKEGRAEYGRGFLPHCHNN